MLARVAGAAIVFALQRPSPVKAIYNTCAYAFEAATVATLIHALLPSGAALDLRAAAVCCLVVPTVDVLMSLLVVVVISLRGQMLDRREMAEILVPAALFSLASTAYALVAALLIESGPLGFILLAAAAVSGGALFRAYLVRRRRHQALALIHDFVEQGAGVHSLEGLAERHARAGAGPVALQ